MNLTKKTFTIKVSESIGDVSALFYLPKDEGLIDEGTSALDEKNAERIEKCLLENPRLTLILVSHHLTEARKRQFDEVYKLDTP